MASSPETSPRRVRRPGKVGRSSTIKHEEGCDSYFTEYNRISSHVSGNSTHRSAIQEEEEKAIKEEEVKLSHEEKMRINALEAVKAKQKAKQQELERLVLRKMGHDHPPLDHHDYHHMCSHLLVPSYSFFQQFPFDMAMKLVECLEFKQIKEGVNLYDQGENGSQMFFMVSGEVVVKVLAAQLTTVSKLVGRWGGGKSKVKRTSNVNEAKNFPECLGESVLIAQGKYKETASVTETCIVGMLSIRRFKRVLLEHPEVIYLPEDTLQAMATDIGKRTDREMAALQHLLEGRAGFDHFDSNTLGTLSAAITLWEAPGHQVLFRKHLDQRDCDYVVVTGNLLIAYQDFQDLEDEVSEQDMRLLRGGQDGQSALTPRGAAAGGGGSGANSPRTLVDPDLLQVPARALSRKQSAASLVKQASLVRKASRKFSLSSTFKRVDREVTKSSEKTIPESSAPAAASPLGPASAATADQRNGLSSPAVGGGGASMPKIVTSKRMASEAAGRARGRKVSIAFLKDEGRTLPGINRTVTLKAGASIGGDGGGGTPKKMSALASKFQLTSKKIVAIQALGQKPLKQESSGQRSPRSSFPGLPPAPATAASASGRKPPLPDSANLQSQIEKQLEAKAAIRTKFRKVLTKVSFGAKFVNIAAMGAEKARRVSDHASGTVGGSRLGAGKNWPKPLILSSGQAFADRQLLGSLRRREETGIATAGSRILIVPKSNWRDLKQGQEVDEDHREVVRVLHTLMEKRSNSDVDILVHLTRENDYLASLSREVLRQLLRHVQHEVFSQMDMVFPQNAPITNTSKFYIVLKGAVKIYIDSDFQQQNRKKGAVARPTFHSRSEQNFREFVRLEMEREKLEGPASLDQLEEYQNLWFSQRYGSLVWQFTRGNSFGELGFLNNVPRTATVVCSEDCEFLTLSRRDFMEVLKDTRMSDVVDRISHLKVLEPLRDASEFRLQKIACHLNLESFHCSHHLITEGEDNSKFYIIKSGEIKVLKKVSQEARFVDERSPHTLQVRSKQVKALLLESLSQQESQHGGLRERASTATQDLAQDYLRAQESCARLDHVHAVSRLRKMYIPHVMEVGQLGPFELFGEQVLLSQGGEKPGGAAPYSIVVGNREMKAYTVDGKRFLQMIDDKILKFLEIATEKRKEWVASRMKTALEVLEATHNPKELDPPIIVNHRDIVMPEARTFSPPRSPSGRTMVSKSGIFPLGQQMTPGSPVGGPHISLFTPLAITNFPITPHPPSFQSSPSLSHHPHHHPHLPSSPGGPAAGFHTPAFNPASPAASRGMKLCSLDLEIYPENSQEGLFAEDSDVSLGGRYYSPQPEKQSWVRPSLDADKNRAMSGGIQQESRLSREHSGRVGRESSHLKLPRELSGGRQSGEGRGLAREPSGRMGAGGPASREQSGRVVGSSLREQSGRTDARETASSRISTGRSRDASGRSRDASGRPRHNMENMPQMESSEDFLKEIIRSGAHEITSFQTPIKGIKPMRPLSRSVESFSRAKLPLSTSGMLTESKSVVWEEEEWEMEDEAQKETQLREKADLKLMFRKVKELDVLYSQKNLSRSIGSPIKQPLKQVRTHHFPKQSAPLNSRCVPTKS